LYRLTAVFTVGFVAVTMVLGLAIVEGLTPRGDPLAAAG
jgi:hypothetical protein